VLAVSERRVCKVLSQSRSSQRYKRKVRDDEEALTERIIELAIEYGRYGYRRITALLKQEGWRVNHKRVERIWRREGLRVPSKQPIVRLGTCPQASSSNSTPKAWKARNLTFWLDQFLGRSQNEGRLALSVVE